MKVVINKCFGGFGISQAAYEKLIEWGVPVQKYIKQERDPKTLLYKPQPLNDGEVIFDRELTPPEEDSFSALYWKYKGQSDIQSRYWDSWIGENRSHPLLIRLVQELGDAVNTRFSELTIVDIPDGAEFEIDEYDGNESVHEKHRVWG